MKSEENNQINKIISKKMGEEIQRGIQRGPSVILVFCGDVKMRTSISLIF
jgi:hypothetical protein